MPNKYAEEISPRIAACMMYSCNSWFVKDQLDLCEFVTYGSAGIFSSDCFICTHLWMIINLRRWKQCLIKSKPVKPCLQIQQDRCKTGGLHMPNRYFYNNICWAILQQCYLSQPVKHLAIIVWKMINHQINKNININHQIFKIVYYVSYYFRLLKINLNRK